MRIQDGEVTEGIWENANVISGEPIEKEEVKSYNPNVHIIARKIDY